MEVIDCEVHCFAWWVQVDFSRYFKGQLLTSGVGHVRFWKMASTFTGLKLEVGRELWFCSEFVWKEL